VIIRERRIRRYGFMLLALLGIAGVLGLSATGRLALTLAPSDVGTVDRWDMWQAAVGMIRDRPFLGHGINTFMANYLDYWVGGEQVPRYAHNCFLQMAAETGFIGLWAFLWLLGVLISCLMQALKRADPRRRMLLLGFLAGLLAFILQAAVDTNFYAMRQAVLFWALAGLALGMSQSQEPLEN
jgi:O-antigen ligase